MAVALISVHDKDGIAGFAKGIQAAGFEILSTGGTAKLLKENGVSVVDVSSYTASPEMLGGRVKTLHPKIHAGILARESDLPELARQGVKPIDLVVVNLYPFEQAAASGAAEEKIIEEIDIGGVALLRAAAKNFDRVAVVSDKGQYPLVADELKKSDGRISSDTRRALASEAFSRVAYYDAVISRHYSIPQGDGCKFPNRGALPLEKIFPLRYGENPQQKACFYSAGGANDFRLARQLQGKELSYNNILDAGSAIDLITEPWGGTACVIIKHTNACGGAIAATAAEAYSLALATDPIAAFGGVVGFNCAVDEAAAEKMAGQFLEVVVAPGFTPGAVGVLGKKKNLRLLDVTEFLKRFKPSAQFRSVPGGLLVQESDTAGWAETKFTFPAKNKPTAGQLASLKFATIFVKHSKSNAIVLARPGQVIGFGVGQMSRVDSVKIAVEKARAAGFDTAGCVMSSDAFFPFRDAVDVAAEAGVAAIAQPGGSIRDAEVVAACDERGIALVFTGVRHFKH